MAVTIFLNELNDALPGNLTSKDNGESLRFRSNDSSSTDASNPLIRPNAGVYRSYEKYLQAELTDLDGADSISSVELFTTSSPIDGVAIVAEQRVAYVLPKAGGYNAAAPMIVENGGIVDFFTKDSDNPFILQAGVQAAPAAFGDFIALQMEVYPNAAIATTADVNIILRYDRQDPA
tara:strand:- start:3402 stop:3932 length:531 start_codon:yes stop_codon:yes gene_type:complete